jgi:hypothetical protein
VTVTGPIVVLITQLLAREAFPSREASSTSPAEAPFVEAVGRVYEVLGTKKRP